MLIYGRNSIVERLKANPASIKKIYLKEGIDEPELIGMIKSKNVSYEFISGKGQFRETERRQWIFAKIEDFEYASLEELLRLPDKKRPSLIMLDRVTDPQNLGAIIRIAACLGGFAIVIPERESCEINDTVLNIASGGENYIPICKVNNLSNALMRAKKENYWLVGAVAEGGEDINKVSLPFPVCLVLGSEGRGIRHGVLKQLEIKVSLPMKGAALSFNVAMAAAIFCYEIARQRETASK